MDLKHLRGFLAVAESLHFGSAAKAVNLSQPALSRQVQTLEEEIGVALFLRDRRKTVLTPAGRVFIEEAREILFRFEQAAKRAQRATLGQIGILRIGFVSTAAALLIPPIVKRFLDLYPEVELELRNVLTTDQVTQLGERKLDVGFLRIPITAPEEILTKVVHREPFVILLPASHPLASKKRLRLEQTRNADFVMYQRKRAPGFHDRVLGMLNGAGFSPHIVQEASEMYTVVSLVAAGLGIAIVPSSVQHYSVAGVVARELPAKARQSEIALAVNKKHISPAAQKFIDVALAMHMHRKRR